MPNKKKSYNSKRECSETILIQEIPVHTKTDRQKANKLTCTCGKCNCRKHHCPIHFSTTSKLIADKNLRVNYQPTTDYQSTFRPIKNLQACRPALKIPPRVLLKPPSNRHDMQTVNRQEFIQHPQTKTESFKPKELAHMSKAPLEGNTSYKADYPPRTLAYFNPPANKTMQMTVRQDPSNKDNYVTMNQEMLKRWSGNHCPPAYSEPIQTSFFQGKFDGKTTFQNDFKEEIARMGKPSTSYKKDEKTHLNDGEFHSETTNQMTYSLPLINARDQLHLRRDAKKNIETIDPASGRVQNVTQYRSDNPGFSKFPTKRNVCVPAIDSLQLFRGKRSNTTENRASYNMNLLREAPRPRTSFKKQEDLHTNGGHFDDMTSLKIDFQPIPLEHILAQSQVDKFAAAIGYSHKAGYQAKKAQDFGVRFSDKTTNNTHFQHWDVSPRIRHGDKSERTYRPSDKSFNFESETRSNFVAIKGKPSESCKPLEVRFQQSRGASVPMAGKSAYTEDFLPKQLHARERCPVELIQT